MLIHSASAANIVTFITSETCTLQNLTNEHFLSIIPGESDLWLMDSFGKMVSKLTTCTHYQATAEHQSRNHFNFCYVHIFIFNISVIVWFMKISSCKQKKGWATMHFYYKKQFNYFVYKKIKQKPNEPTKLQKRLQGCDTSHLWQ